MHAHIACPSGGGRQSAASPLTVGRHPMDDGVLITASGEVDITNASRLESCLRRGTVPGKPVVLDLTLLAFMDGNGLRVIERLHAACANTGSPLHLAGLRGMPARLLRITGRWDLLNVHDSIADAVRAAGRGAQARRPRASSAG